MGKFITLIFGFILRWGMGLGIPFAWIYFFKGEGTVEFFLSWALWVIFLSGMIHHGKTKFPRLSLLLSAVVTVLLIFGGAIFFALSAFSPSEAYLLWLKAVKVGSAPGVVGFQLGILLGYVTTILAVLSWNTGLKGPVLILLCLFSLVGLVIWPHVLWGLGIILGLGGLLFLAARSNQPAVSWHRSILEALGIPLVVILLSGPFFLAPYRNFYNSPKAVEILRPLADEFMDPALWTLVEDPGQALGDSTREPNPPRVNSPLFEIKGLPDHFYYLRAQIYDYYTGKNWQRYPRILETPTVNLSKTEVLEPNLTLLTLAELFPLIPHPLETLEVNVTPFFQGKNLSAQYMPQGIRLDSPLVRGDTVNYELGEKSSFEIERLDPEYGLQGKDLVSHKVKQFVKSLNFSNERNILIFALKLQKFLMNNYTYELKNPGGEGPPLERFLFGEKKGYSLHFATAGVMLFRLKGIPARLVKGYALLTDSQGQGKITTMNAHDWVEFYMEKIGWLTLEVCPPFIDKSWETPSSTEKYESQRTRDQISLITGKTINTAPVSDLGVWVWASSLGLVVSLFLGIFLLSSLKNLKDKPEKVPAELGTLPRSLQKLLIFSLKRNFPDPSKEGWEVWISRWGFYKPWLTLRLSKILLPGLFSNPGFTLRDGKFFKLLKSKLR